MSIDADILEKVDRVAGGCKRPGHFTDLRLCKECAERDEFLRSLVRTT